jgi:hypothetical protein
MTGESTGSTVVIGVISVTKLLSSVGRTSVSAVLQNGTITDLAGSSTGSTTVSGYLDPAPTVTWPLPYPLGIPGGTVNLYGASEGSTTVGDYDGPFTQLTTEFNGASSTGTTTTTGALSVTNPYSGSSSGSTTVSGEIFNTGDVDLSGSSQGSTRVSAWKFNASPRSTTVALYLYVNIGIGFDPTDTYTGPGNLVDQVFPDGDVDLFPRTLYWTINLGVGFDPTDDVLTRGEPYETIGDYISQVFPDGNVIDFTRALYQYLNVIALDKPDGWVTVGPTPETIPPRWKAKPPKWTRRP